MIKQLQGVFSGYPNLMITDHYDGYMVANDHMNLCVFMVGDGGIYDAWILPHQTCLSQNMVKVLYDALVLLNEEWLE